MKIKGQLVDVLNRKIFPAEITIENGLIAKVSPFTPGENEKLPFLTPGFIDAHVHIESSMLVPSEFARLAVVHGTVATVSDPHEIANVCGISGVEFMLENSRKVPLKFNFGAPSCVPATIFETSGATLNAEEVASLLERDDIKYLSEMMNFPGVLYNDEEVMKKIASAHQLGKPVDGHAPGLIGEEAKIYIEAGISTDHECFTEEEALGKLAAGMKIIIREGSAAKNFEALIGLLNDHANMIMFCSDDKHPDSLAEGHINQLCQRAVAKGIDVFHVLQAACINPVLHYKLDVGYLQTGQPADFIVLENLETFDVLQTFIDGILVAENGKSLIKRIEPDSINNFSCRKKEPADFATTFIGQEKIPVIEAIDGQLITNKLLFNPIVENGQIVNNVDEDILKIVVVNRYSDAPISTAFIKNFGLKEGAIASSVAHDSHNIVAVGVDDESICKAVNVIIEHQGGISCMNEQLEIVLPLPVAGLMSTDDGYKVAEQYSLIDQAAKAAGATLSAPFMTLSFMALLVIPHLKLSDKGLFDGDKFALV